MGGKIVEDDDVTLPQFGAEHLLQVSGEDLGVDRPFDQEGCGDTLGPQGRNESGTLPVPVRHAANTAPAFGAAPVEPRHLGVQPRFVDEDQVLAVPAGLGPAPLNPGGLYVRSLLLGGVRGFFYSSNPADRSGATRQ